MSFLGLVERPWYGPAMARGAQVIWLVATALLVMASSSSRSVRHGSQALRPERDRELNHPALRVENRSRAVALIRFRGSSRRDLIAPPQENVRTLIAAGTYRFEVRLNGKVVRRGAVRLRKGYRYHLRLSP